MHIRKTTAADLDAVLAIYERARAFMAQNGNPHQWRTGFPPRALLEQDIADGHSYVCTHEGEIAAVFSFFVGEEPTYRVMRDGAWPDDRPYGVVHRLASAQTVRGAAAFCLAHCVRQCGCLRIDTHRDNQPMQRLLTKLGFRYCGLIDLENGRGERLAYQKNAD